MLAKAQGKRTSLFLVVAWCLISAAANVYVASLVRGMPASMLCFGIFTIALLVFLTVKLISLRKWLDKLHANLWWVIFINITTFVTWYSTIYSLKYIEPAVVTAIILTTMPMFAFIINLIRKNRAGHVRYDAVITLLLFSGVVLIAALVFSRKTAVTTPVVVHTFISFFLAMLAGFSLSVNNIVVKKLVDRGFTPTDILSARFFLLVFVSGLISLSVQSVGFGGLLLLELLVAALVLVIIPQLLLQLALQKLEAISVSIASSFKPAIVFCFEIFDRELSLTIWTISVLLYLAIISLSAIVYRYRCLTNSRHLN